MNTPPVKPDQFNLDAAIGVGLNQLGEPLGAPALEWAIEQPEPGASAEFHGHAGVMTPDEVHAVLDRWAECLGLSERRDHGGMRENVGLLETRTAYLPVRLLVWGVINRAEFEDEPPVESR